jgi:hypothetical protein
MNEGFGKRKKPEFKSGLYKPEEDASAQPQKDIDKTIDEALRKKRNKFYERSQDEIDATRKRDARMLGEKDESEGAEEQ